MLRKLWAICLLSLAGCGSKTPPTGQIAPPPPEASTPEDAEVVAPKASTATSEDLSATLTGVLSEGGESRGKTIAAWNGIPVGERFYHLELDGGQTLHSSATEGFMIRAADQTTAATFAGKRVTITGKWEVPAPVEPQPAEPMQMPVAGDGGVMERATIFIAEGFQAAD